jgi:hypothetical protein
MYDYSLQEKEILPAAKVSHCSFAFRRQSREDAEQKRAAVLARRKSDNNKGA